MMKRVLVSSLLFLEAGGTALAQSPGAFTATGSMITPRVGHSATLLLDGRVLIAGGWRNLPATLDSSVPLASMEIYDPETKTFNPTGDMTILRGYFVTALLPNGKVLFVGSDAGQRVAAEVYDPLIGTFSAAGSIDETDITCSAATLLSTGKLLITVYKWWPPQGATPYVYRSDDRNVRGNGKLRHRYSVVGRRHSSGGRPAR